MLPSRWAAAALANGTETTHQTPPQGSAGQPCAPSPKASTSEPSLLYAGYKRRVEHVAIGWDAGTVAITDAQGHTIATYDKPPTRHGWHGPTQNRPSTKS